jgi:protocatechuate 3,4-dioxygenase beta subunit
LSSSWGEATLAGLFRTERFVEPPEECSMSERITPPSSRPAAPDRRTFFGLAARGALSVVVSQALLGCSTDSATAAGTDAGDATATGSTSSGGSASTSCVLTAALTEGPYFVDEKLQRSDIRADPATGVVSGGMPLTLKFGVARVSGSACTPLTGAYLDVWHCDAAGLYSDESANGTGGRRFLRGYQVTDADGVASFITVYPGWYSGRAVHIHFKLRLYAGSTKSYEFTSQFFFDESVTSAVHATSPYSAHGSRNTTNSTDGIYNGLSAAAKSALTLQTTRTSDGYAGVINLFVQVG